MLVTQKFAESIQAALSAHAFLSISVFFVTTVLAVVFPVLTNLALIPAFVLVWGPWITALLLLAGWVAGAAISFWLARKVREKIIRRFPSIQRHAHIDRLIHPEHRISSLILLRMTFPVDLLSYALGLFSPKTTLQENVISTVVGAAPFAFVFALLPTLSGATQLVISAASLSLFVAYAVWILNRPRVGS